MNTNDLPILSVSISLDKKIFHTKLYGDHVNGLSDDLLKHLNTQVLPFFKASVEKEVMRRETERFFKNMKAERCLP